MESTFACLGFLWGIVGVMAAFSAGKPGLWRTAIFLGPLAFLVFKPKS